MKNWRHKIEVLVDKVIPYMLIVLLAVILIEIFFHSIAEKYHSLILVLDNIVISVFVLDLTFKYLRIRKMSKFFKECWLDILAILPFYLVFRLFEGVIAASSLKNAQSILHEGLEIEKEGSKIIREAEKIYGASRTRYLARSGRFVRIFARVPRIVKAFIYYEKPTKHA